MSSGCQRKLAGLRFFTSLPTVVLLALGCSGGELKKAQADLKACQERRASLQWEVSTCRDASERQLHRLEAVQAALGQAVPAPVEEVREQVLASLPAEVRVELELQLDRYFVSVARAYKNLEDRNTELLRELKETRREIATTQGRVEDVAGTASEIEEGIAAVQESAAEIKEHQARQQAWVSSLQGIANSILEFDRTKVSCRECRDRMKMRDKARAELLRFHSELVQDLTSLRTAAAAEGD